MLPRRLDRPGARGEVEHAGRGADEPEGRSREQGLQGQQTTLDLADAHPKDKALTTAQAAYFLLAIGIGDYVQYLVAAAFLRADRTDLNHAVRETTSGKRLAARALRELG